MTTTTVPDHPDRHLHHRPHPQPHRLRRPPRHGHQGPRLVQRVRRLRLLRRREPGQLAPAARPSRPPASTPATPTATATCKSNDFFDMETYPEITFASTAVEQVDADELPGDRRPDHQGRHQARHRRLRVHRHRRRPLRQPRIGFEGKTTINRKDWGVNWNAALEAGGVLVSEKVTLEFEVSAIRTDAS